MRKSKFIEFVFSCVPGAGHMYLGYMNMGIQLMFTFFGSIYIFGSMLNGFLLPIIVPIIWFYSVFDGLMKTDLVNNSENGQVNKDENFPLFNWILGYNASENGRVRMLGIGFIVFGAAIIVDKILLPKIDHVVLEYSKTIVIALILIVIGVRFITKNKEKV